MPTAAKTDAPPRKRTATPKRINGHQTPLLDPPADEPEQQTVDGLKVVEAVRGQNLPNAPMNFIKLVLEDGTHRYQCADCPEVIGTRDGIRAHRKEVHPGPVRPSTKPGRPTANPSVRIPLSVADMPLSHILALVEDVLTYGSLVERLEAERDHLRSELLDVNRKYNALTRALEKVGFMPKLEDES